MFKDRAFPDMITRHKAGHQGRRRSRQAPTLNAEFATKFEQALTNAFGTGGAKLSSMDSRCSLLGCRWSADPKTWHSASTQAGCCAQIRGESLNAEQCLVIMASKNDKLLPVAGLLLERQPYS